MFDIDILGYLAGACLLLMASMKNQTHMRMCNIAANLFFISYGYLAGLMPILILNSIILALHVFRLVQSQVIAKTA